MILVQEIKDKGMNFCCWMLNCLCWLKGFTGEEITGWKWKIFLFIDWLEFIPHRLFAFFYKNSREEFNAAVLMEYGEDLSHYNHYQQTLIKQIYGRSL